MDYPLCVSGVRFTAAPQSLVSRGLLGYLACTLNEQLAIDGLALRRTVEGKIYVSFPVRHDRRGQEHPVVRPIDQAARASIEGQILAALEGLGFAA